MLRSQQPPAAPGSALSTSVSDDGRPALDHPRQEPTTEAMVEVEEFMSAFRAAVDVAAGALPRSSSTSASARASPTRTPASNSACRPAPSRSASCARASACSAPCSSTSAACAAPRPASSRLRVAVPNPFRIRHLAQPPTGVRCTTDAATDAWRIRNGFGTATWPDRQPAPLQPWRSSTAELGHRRERGLRDALPALDWLPGWRGSGAGSGRCAGRLPAARGGHASSANAPTPMTSSGRRASITRRSMRSHRPRTAACCLGLLELVRRQVGAGLRLRNASGQ